MASDAIVPASDATRTLNAFLRRAFRASREKIKTVNKKPRDKYGRESHEHSSDYIRGKMNSDKNSPYSVQKRAGREPYPPFFIEKPYGESEREKN